MMAAAEAQLRAGNRPKIELFGFGEDVQAFAKARRSEGAADESRLSERWWRCCAGYRHPPKGVFVFSDGRRTETPQVSPRSPRVTGGSGCRSTSSREVSERWRCGDPERDRTSGVAFGTKVPVRRRPRRRVAGGVPSCAFVRSEPRRPAPGQPPDHLIDGEIDHELVIESDRASGPLVVEVPPLVDEAVLQNNRVPFQVARATPRSASSTWKGPRPTNIAGSATPWSRTRTSSASRWRSMTSTRDATTPGRRPGTRLSDDAGGALHLRRCHLQRHQPGRIHAAAARMDRRAGQPARRRLRHGRRLHQLRLGRWDETIWDGMIPVDMSGSATGGEGTLNDISLKVQIPPEANGHPIWHFDDDPAKNREILNSMPILQGTNLTDRLKPAATVLGLGSVTLPARLQARRRMLQQTPRHGTSAGRRVRPTPSRSGSIAHSCLLLPVVRQGTHVRLLERHDLRLGP